MVKSLPGTKKNGAPCAGVTNQKSLYMATISAPSASA